MWIGQEGWIDFGCLFDPLQCNGIRCSLCCSHLWILAQLWFYRSIGLIYFCQPIIIINFGFTPFFLCALLSRCVYAAISTDPSKQVRAIFQHFVCCCCCCRMWIKMHSISLMWIFLSKCRHLHKMLCMDDRWKMESATFSWQLNGSKVAFNPYDKRVYDHLSLI